MSQSFPAFELGAHIDGFTGDELQLTRVLLMGFPRVPFSSEPRLLCATGEVTGVIDKYTGGHHVFVISSMARGGFSGGPVVQENGMVLGLVTESLLQDHKFVELGFTAVLTVLPIYICLFEYGVLPDLQKQGWGDLWDGDYSRRARPTETATPGPWMTRRS